jgi:hypothetical protein
MSLETVYVCFETSFRIDSSNQEMKSFKKSPLALKA